MEGFHSSANNLASGLQAELVENSGYVYLWAHSLCCFQW